MAPPSRPFFPAAVPGMTQIGLGHVINTRTVMVVLGTGLVMCGACPELFQETTSIWRGINWNWVNTWVTRAAEGSKWFYTVVLATRELYRRWPEITWPAMTPRSYVTSQSARTSRDAETTQSTGTTRNTDTTRNTGTTRNADTEITLLKRASERLAAEAARAAEAAHAAQVAFGIKPGSPRTMQAERAALLEEIRDAARFQSPKQSRNSGARTEGID